MLPDPSLPSSLEPSRRRPNMNQAKANSGFHQSSSSVSPQTKIIIGIAVTVGIAIGFFLL